MHSKRFLDLENWKGHLGHFSGKEWWLVTGVLGTALQCLAALPVVWLIRLAFDRAIPARDVRLLLAVGVALLSIRLASVGVFLAVRALNIWVMEAAVLRLRVRLLEKLYRLPRSYYAGVAHDALHTAIVHDTGRVKAMGNALFGQLLPGLVSGVVLVALLLALDWRLCVMMFAAVPLMLLGNRVLSGLVRCRVGRFHDAFRRFAHHTFLLVRALDLTHVHAFERGEVERQRTGLEALRASEGAMAFACAIHGQAQGSIVAVAAILVLVAGGIGVAQGVTTLGSFFAFYFTASLLNQSSRMTIDAIPDILAGQESLANLGRLIDVPEGPPYGGTRRIAFRGSIRLEGVRFRYGGPPVLDGVDLEIRPGSRVTIGGPNGAGKSTLLYLILGLYRPEAGTIAADGIPYDELELEHLRRQFGVVMQAPHLLPGTIRENIAYGRPGADEAAIREACRVAMAEEFIEALPMGLDTPMGDDGALLSGGQRQKIAVARALLVRPRLLVLDEPTNHLDPASVGRLLENLRSVAYRPAVLTITHDARAAGDAARHYTLRDGILVPSDLVAHESPRPRLGVG
jgi:ATP-binding cassette, subfamily B, bacterial